MPMHTNLEDTRLYHWLKKTKPTLAARVLMIRNEQSKWLPYITTLFAHYPQHGVEHSDRIVKQLSDLLFKTDENGATSELSTNLSASEVYCLLCAAYLHDMGMVVSPEEQATILDSDDWKTFVAEGGKGYGAYKRYEESRKSAATSIGDGGHFYADVALRHLIADFVRRDHHQRAIQSLRMHEFLKQLVDHGDSVAFHTISAICVGHGLDDRELLDNGRFPEERTVLGDKVNVRFLARLLRIGDLLDMDTARTDPMTAKAVGPLPLSAVPHWKQYHDKIDENISPDVVRFEFKCRDQETHRVLRDWLAWLEAEIRATVLGQAHAVRHRGWRGPRCKVESQATSSQKPELDDTTIVVRPAESATYEFHDWRIEMDQQAVLGLLINNVYGDPLVFIRELIQNALDATRCQMYTDFAREHPGSKPPERPTQFPASFRQRYPVRLALRDELVKSSLDQPEERRKVLIIEDLGIGMDEEIIKKYLLQAGRSYYTSDQFRKHFSFSPTSRFGVGFLSVFAVSDHVTVETARRDPVTGQTRGVRLTLRGARNYILTEPWKPFEERSPATRVGTRIRVILNEWHGEKTLAELTRHHCVAVEVPVQVEEKGELSEVRPDRWTDGEVLARGASNPNARFVVRAFEVDQEGYEGQLAVVAYEDELGEGWCDCWPRALSLGGQPTDVRPSLGKSWQSLHGIRYGSAPHSESWRYGMPWTIRLDARKSIGNVQLSRFQSGQIQTLETSIVEHVAQAAVSNHLEKAVRSKGPKGIYYRGSVLRDAPVGVTWKKDFPETVVTWQAGKRVDVSLRQLLAMDMVTFALWRIPNYYLENRRSPAKRMPIDCPRDAPVVSLGDTPSWANEALATKIQGMSLTQVEQVDDLWLLTFDSTSSNLLKHKRDGRYAVWTFALGASAAPIHKACDMFGGLREVYIFNSDHPLVAWFERLREGARANVPGIRSADVDGLWEFAAENGYSMAKLLKSWIKSAEVPKEFRPPVAVQSGEQQPFTERLRMRQTVLD